jgi:hypothetical protein
LRAKNRTENTMTELRKTVRVMNGRYM